MIPHMTLLERLVGWLLWKYNRFDTPDDSGDPIFQVRNALDRSAGVLTDYIYYRRWKENQ